MSGRVVCMLPFVMSLGNDSVADEHDGPDGHIAVVDGRPRLYQRNRHRFIVGHQFLPFDSPPQQEPSSVLPNPYRDHNIVRAALGPSGRLPVGAPKAVTTK